MSAVEFSTNDRGLGWGGLALCGMTGAGASDEVSDGVSDEVSDGVRSESSRSASGASYSSEGSSSLKQRVTW